MEYYAGIDLGGTKIYSILINEKGNILARDKVKLTENKEINNVLELIQQSYNSVIEKAGIPGNEVKAVGMAVPSAVNIEKGILLNAPNLGWENIRITKMVSSMLGKKVFVDNDVNLGTYGEYSFGKGKKFNHLYGIFAGTGIGGGYIFDGKIVRGASYTAGEIGHIIIKQKGPQCNCGNLGCLEAIGGKIGIINYLKKKVDKQGEKTLLSEIAPEWRKGVGSSALRKALAAKDPLVIKAINKSAIAIGIAAANVINLIGVEAIIAGGGLIEELGDIYLPIIRSTMKQYAMANGAAGVTLLQSELGDDAVALGGAWIVTKEETARFIIG